ncbi:Coiled-coil domain-containing protein [Operophtera brumata]|uniref:Coiled-coil domain-containing protein n=1 Tax=Operophtera brumata TaxID=104452 RepID=A0A0L7KZN6_OPEBR|nr:Coiled-coil domain-containing protein [Operophtera brumata]
MQVEVNNENGPEELEEEEIIVDPIDDIIDYLVRSAKVSFKNAHVDEAEIRTYDKIRMAKDLYTQKPIDFLIQFGKFLTPYHIEYFEKKSLNNRRYHHCIEELKVYHSETSRHKRVRNRRYKALQQLQNETDYFSEKQMMLRNPLLYEQLVGQYLTEEEIRERDGIDNENLNLLTMILDTVDRNHMREVRNEQMLAESLEAVDINIQKTSNEHPQSKKMWGDFETHDTKKKVNKKWGEFEIPDTKPSCNKRWGDFDTPDTIPSFKPEVRKQTMISAPERRLLREEFYQEMCSSFIEGRDDYDYESVDNNEQFDDLKQVSQDAEDRYFDSETNEVENLEEHMKLVEEYGRRGSSDNGDCDPLDEFMEHISNKLKTT